MVAVLEVKMKVTFDHGETAREVMEQLRFVLMEFGVILEVESSDNDGTTYSFTHAEPLKSTEDE